MSDSERASNAIKVVQQAAWERLDEIEELVRHGLTLPEIARETDIPMWAIEWVLAMESEQQ